VIASLVRARSSTALDHIQGILGALAASMEKSQSPTLSDEHAALRSTLSAVEQATSDGERERASGFGIPFPAKQFARRWLLCAQSRMNAPPHLAGIAGYAGVGALYFLISGIWLTVSHMRRQGRAA
jgi:hypothetical protein